MAAVNFTDSMKILFTCVGRRVELLQAFRAAARRLRIELRIIGTDVTPTAPGLICADERHLSAPISDPRYIDDLLHLVAQTGARALIPTIDTDLLALASRRAEFEALGCTPMISEPAVISICRDKVETHRFLQQSGIDTPATYLPDELRSLKPLTFPYFAKPRSGSASVRVARIEDEADLEYHVRKSADLIIQEYVEGAEHTLDVYVGLTGRPRCVVPRRRWQVRGGEVTKGVVVKDRDIMEAGRQVALALGASTRGLLTLQCIVTPERRIRFIEINPRFGGGAPMGIAAGADYPGWLLQELRGEQPQIEFDGFRHGLCMLRYDWSTFVQLGDDLAPRLADPLWAFPQYE